MRVDDQFITVFCVLSLQNRPCWIKVCLACVLTGPFLQVSWAAAVDRAVDGVAVLNLTARWRQTAQNIQFETFTTLINRWYQSGVQVVTKSYPAGEKKEATESLGLKGWRSSVGLPHKPVGDSSGPGRWENYQQINELSTKWEQLSVLNSKAYFLRM